MRSEPRGRRTRSTSEIIPMLSQSELLRWEKRHLAGTSHDARRHHAFVGFQNDG